LSGQPGAWHLCTMALNCISFHNYSTMVYIDYSLSMSFYDLAFATQDGTKHGHENFTSQSTWSSCSSPSFFSVHAERVVLLIWL